MINNRKGNIHYNHKIHTVESKITVPRIITVEFFNILRIHNKLLSQIANVRIFKCNKIHRLWLQWIFIWVNEV